MTTWPAENFLLESRSAARLYREYAAPLPVIDYHNHLPAAQIAADHRFADLTEIWLDGDHYKWRAMRACGIDESLITGPADPAERFRAWAACLPRLIGSPLYQWSHSELATTFGFAKQLGPETAAEAWTFCNAKLATAGFKIGRAHV